jgi:hypothetical protein
MNLEFPYQLVAFIDNEPAIGEPVYYGTNGWYPQIALKRRFKIVGINEGELLAKLTQYCNETGSFSIKTKSLTQHERMPVKILAVEATPELINFHQNFITHMGKCAISRYPDREGDNYLPHITAEYNGKMVVDDSRFNNKEIRINRISLLKDVYDENSQAHAYFELSQDQNS